MFMEHVFLVLSGVRVQCLCHTGIPIGETPLGVVE